MRFVVVLLIGLFMGAFGAVAGIGAMRQGTPHNDVVMSMIGWQTGALRAMQTSGKCDAAEIARRLTIARAVAGETDAAFLPVGDDDLFRKHSAALTSALDSAIAAAPADCNALGVAMTDIGAACKACHQDFR